MHYNIRHVLDSTMYPDTRTEGETAHWVGASTWEKCLMRLARLEKLGNTS